ncbi:hypothetical protein ELH24_21830 [Rhizobium ruizarguesonis]|uniref:hypothetical protein n=1 Tax=Rhizobium ruizarguesonis TaxID=2081791 RepID=UPI001030D8EE|nr:hypothetical protein [Rhizobium ruizarguesonis]TBD01845.1 hypothetical protein ELH25_25550 [Rhizobium ruizarguesonis]TBD17991.1 hypothetical protein ELH24_21830 [Rhizobium ruizarguesonis]TBE99234.1 hypothetical protein ELG98_22945 [Rhizobium ruizarguesonis]
MAAPGGRKLPKRLQIDFKHKKPCYEVYTPKGCNRRDLVHAGISEEHADALLWNDYHKKPMRYTLIRPEEWFWTDRDWWENEKESPHLKAMYDLAGGCFTDLSPSEQARFLGLPFQAETGKKGRGPMWIDDGGETVDIVRFMHRRLTSLGYDMMPAYSQGCSLMVANINRADKVDPAFFDEDKTSVEERELACKGVDDVLSRPSEVWDRKPDYYFQILNTLSSRKDYDRAAMLETVRVIGVETYARILKHYCMHRTYQNQMNHPGLPPLAGRKNGKLQFFFITQQASFRIEAHAFIRNYAYPLKLDVSLIQLTPDKA